METLKTIALTLGYLASIAAFLAGGLKLLDGYKKILAGAGFTEAVKAYQEDLGGVVDGEITAMAQTWQALLGAR